MNFCFIVLDKEDVNVNTTWIQSLFRCLGKVALRQTITSTTEFVVLLFEEKIMAIGQNEKKKKYINWNILSFWGKIAKKKNHTLRMLFLLIYRVSWSRSQIIRKLESTKIVLVISSYSRIYSSNSRIYSRYVSFFSRTTVYSRLYLFHFGRNFFENSILEDRQWNGDFPSADLIQILTAFNNLTCVGVNSVGFVDSSKNTFKGRTFVVHAFLTTAISVALASH